MYFCPLFPALIPTCVPCYLQEYQEDNPNLSITETNKSQTVYMYKCNKCTIKVDGKVNGIILGECVYVWFSEYTWLVCTSS